MPCLGRCGTGRSSPSRGDPPANGGEAERGRPTHRPAVGTTGQSGSLQHRPRDLARRCRRDGISWGMWCGGGVGGTQGLQGKGESSGERRKNFSFPREKTAGVGEKMHGEIQYIRETRVKMPVISGRSCSIWTLCRAGALTRIRVKPKFSFRFLWIYPVASNCCIQIQKQKEPQIPRGAGAQGTGEEGQCPPQAAGREASAALCCAPAALDGSGARGHSSNRCSHAADRAFVQMVFVFLYYNVPLCSHVMGSGAVPETSAAASHGPLFHGR